MSSSLDLISISLPKARKKPAFDQNYVWHVVDVWSVKIDVPSGEFWSHEEEK